MNLAFRLLLVVALAGTVLAQSPTDSQLVELDDRVDDLEFRMGRAESAIRDSAESGAVLFLFGVILLFVEIFVTPGFGVLGIGGLILILAALLNAMTLPDPGIPWIPVPTSFDGLMPALRQLLIALIGTGGIALLTGRLLPKSHLPIILDEKEMFKNVDVEAADRVGDVGRALTTLHPSGSAIFSDERIDVITNGEYIDKETPIRIIATHGNRIVVEKT